MKQVIWSRIGVNTSLKLNDLAESKEITVSELIRQLILKEIEQKEIDMEV